MPEPIEVTMSVSITKTRESGYYPDAYSTTIYSPIRGNTSPADKFVNRTESPVFHGGETITYAKGPKYANGGLTSINWKPCLHSKDTVSSGRYGAYTGFNGQVYRRYKWWTQLEETPGVLNRNNPHVSVPDSDPQLTQTLADEIFRNIDLNCNESVMCYSAVLQAIPLVGSAVKLSTVLNQIGKNLLRSWRRKPFTTVIKSLISGDFINRFVVQTTLQDMRMVANATNYVLKTLMTAARRNQEEYTVLEASKTLDISKESTEGKLNIFLSSPEGAVKQPYTFTEGASVTQKLKWIAKLRYNLDIVSPIQLWATRVGLTKPLESIWDMVPFSFVVDYFFRAGEFLSHLSNEVSSQDGLRGLVASMGRPWMMEKRSAYTEIKTETLTREWPMTGWDTSYLVAPACTARRESCVFSRQPQATIDLSGFWDRGSLWDPQLSFTRVRTMGQLWLQAKI